MHKIIRNIELLLFILFFIYIFIYYYYYFYLFTIFYELINFFIFSIYIFNNNNSKLTYGRSFYRRSQCDCVLERFVRFSLSKNVIETTNAVYNGVFTLYICSVIITRQSVFLAHCPSVASKTELIFFYIFLWFSFYS